MAEPRPLQIKFALVGSIDGVRHPTPETALPAWKNPESAPITVFQLRHTHLMEDGVDGDQSTHVLGPDGAIIDAWEDDHYQSSRPMTLTTRLDSYGNPGLVLKPGETLTMTYKVMWMNRWGAECGFSVVAWYHL